MLAMPLMPLEFSDISIRYMTNGQRLTNDTAVVILEPHIAESVYRLQRYDILTRQLDTTKKLIDETTNTIKLQTLYITNQEVAWKTEVEIKEVVNRRRVITVAAIVGGVAVIAGGWVGFKIGDR